MRIVGPPDRQLAVWEQQIEDATRQALRQVMDRIANRITGSLTAALVAHLPGKHDQSSHGKGGADWRGDNDVAETELRATAASPLRSERRLSGGTQALVTVEDREGGELIRKNVGDARFDPVAKKDADAEHLASLTAHAVGVNAPATVVDVDGSVIMQRVRGKTGAELGQLLPDAIDQDAERMMGLHDVLIGNPDRHAGNWMTDESGTLVGIDHSLAFGRGLQAGHSPFGFSRSFFNSTGTDFADEIDVSPHDMGIIRNRFDSLRPDFEQAGRGDWHEEMMDRLDALEPRATGTRDRL